MNNPVAGLAVGEHTERAANSLGYLGVVPFAVCLGVALWPGATPWHDLAMDISIAYGGIILSFLGGIHWGRALVGNAQTDAPGVLRWSVAPSLLGLIALLLPVPLALGLLIAGYIVLFQLDSRIWEQLPWFADLRGRMTGIVVVLLTGTLVTSL